MSSTQGGGSIASAPASARGVPLSAREPLSGVPAPLSADPVPLSVTPVSLLSMTPPSSQPVAKTTVHRQNNCQPLIRLHFLSSAIETCSLGKCGFNGIIRNYATWSWLCAQNSA